MVQDKELTSKLRANYDNYKTITKHENSKLKNFPTYRTKNFNNNFDYDHVSYDHYVKVSYYHFPRN